MEGVEAADSPQGSASDASTYLRTSCQNLLLDLGYDLHSSPSSDSFIPRVIFDFAANDSLEANDELLGALSGLLGMDGVSDLVTRYFWPVVVDLLARWISASHGEVELLEKRLSAMAAICSSTRGMWNIANSFIETSPFATSPLAHIPTDQLTIISADRLHTLLIAYYRILLADSTIGTRLSWPHAPLHTLRTQHPDAGVRLLAIRVLSMQRPWSESKRLQMEREFVGDVTTIDAEVLFGHEIVKSEGGSAEVRRIMVDGWLLPIMESRRLQKVETFLASQLPISLSSLYTHLSPRITPIAGQLFLRETSSATSGSPFVHVSTAPTEQALLDMAPLLKQGSPILLSSTPSSGKTHLLQYLSTLLHPGINPAHRILSIPLADTTIDVKSLIGTYISSPTKPGTFEWMEGALAKAVRAGRWVILDDIDRASVEMLVTVAGIARSLQPGRPGRRARLAVPGREEIEAGDGFALFATRSTRQDASSPLVFFGHHHFHNISLAPPSDEDVLAILSAKFQALPASVSATLVRMWQELRPMARVSGPVKAREIGLRDLEKWCARVVRNLPSISTMAALENTSAGVFANPVFQDEVLLEAVDTFMASLDSKPASIERRNAMIKVVADAIGMDEERAFALIGRRKPTLEKVASSKQLIIGRTSTPLAPAAKRRSTQSSRPFALTKPSLVLLERIAASSAMGEPTLLVGETGTGKTTAVQYIADTCGKPLTALNLSMQTESSDLLGGFKPIDASVSARLLHAKWQKLFCETFSMAKQQNSAFLEVAAKALSGRKWQRCAELWSASARRAMEKLRRQDEDVAVSPEPGHESSRKRRKPNMRAVKAAVQWQALIVEVSEFDLHHVKMNSKLVFSFVEGPLVKAMQSGEWILLDEINLASQETLEAISTILEGPSASLVLTERGDIEPVTRHPDFRLFACMNPATDVGKKDLPPSLRSRFTEIYAAPPDDDREALVSIVTQYIGDIAAGDKAAILDVAEMYQELKLLSATKEIVDGANTAPHYSMRTLARSLMFAIETAPLFGLRRALWEGCLMAFTMSLDLVSIVRAREVCNRFLLGPMKNAKAVLSQIPSLPSGFDSDDYVRFGPFWLKRGPLPPSPESIYVITPSVQSKLSDLARVVMTHRYPVLIQGPTSSGKTSAVEFLARQTGHRFVRINNHEHTDIQEYLGTYVTDPKTGNLVFQEGLLVTAVRQGHWIVLDELNLAPTDVLEALNRLLDDNRELVIPETQEVVRPHPNFILFATQNPPGLYAGRKVLSRAFRNRFLEVHFDDVPKNELETIICQRCQIAPTYAKKIVQVFEELRHRRQASRVFESKQSFATLRDLFRWAERGAVGYQALGSDGYMLLAERGRQDEDKQVIKGVIEEVLKVSIDHRMIYDLSLETVMARLPFDTIPTSTLVWTRAMQRLFTLVASALANNEPVLLVGETGCGKTSVCDIIALAFKQNLVGVNCHQNMETADLLGSQRPVRNRLERRAKIVARIAGVMPEISATTDEELSACLAELRLRSDVDQAEVEACESELAKLSALFEWSDGPLVHAMNQGDLLLLDEVSLADDSVLERLNSVLEPGRTLVLAEKGGSDIDSATIVAHPNFHVVATMNPGGDFGKKELSPALRNRFTEIWVPPLNDRDDLLQIIGLSWKHKELEVFGALNLDFFTWFGERVGDAAGLGLRDILAWVNFMNEIYSHGGLDAHEVFHHGGQMTIVDGLESLPQCAGMASASVATLRSDCLNQLSQLSRQIGGKAGSAIEQPATLAVTPTSISIGAFGLPRGSQPTADVQFHFNAPTTALNAMRVLRASQLPKAILLEGSPGVGKTSLVTALAAISGYNLQRINLSDQTDLIDLFGSDLPVEGGKAGEFRWRDAAFLDAMQKGDWVLLDEMNLASQTVLEGLNAVLDYRGTVYIPELGRSFARHPNFRIFAAQNPLQQGGGRKGLPKSFLNRFTKVYLQEQTADDLLIICQQLYPMPIDTVQKLIAFNEEIRIATTVNRTIGREGSPWEFNLRDLFRWFGVLGAQNGLELSAHPAEYLRMIYLERFRNQADRDAVQSIFERVFDISLTHRRPTPYLTPEIAQIGHSMTIRAADAETTALIRHEHLDLGESVLKAVELGWLVILAGDSGGGKRSLVRTIAGQAGRGLGEFTMHPGVDTSEILGSFEQQDHRRLVKSVYTALIRLVDSHDDTSPSSHQVRSQIKQLYDDYVRDPTQIVSLLETFGSISQQLPMSNDVTAIQQHLQHIAEVDTASTGFAWVDGQLIDALRNGGWYLISDANLCSPSVLDRLNSLCESNGSLILSEKGSTSGIPEIIKPHPDFRLFMTYDPRFGELSRAMRNRGIELYLQASPSLVGRSLSQSSLMADSLLQSSIIFDEIDSRNPSAVANGVAGSNCASLPYLARLAGSEEDISLLPNAVRWANANESVRGAGASIINTIDPALNPTTRSSTSDDIFRAIQITLRIEIAQKRLQEWVTINAATKAVLAQSAASNSGRKAKRATPGASVYGLIVEMRQKTKSGLENVQAGTAQSLEIVDRVELLLQHLEDRCRTEVFDYSAVGLIAEWLDQELSALSGAEKLTQLVNKSIQHIQTTSGRGQSEIWSMFRSAHEVEQVIPEDLLSMADACRDPKLRFMVLQGLIALQNSTEAETGVEDLKAMLVSVTDRDFQVVASRWTQWPMINTIQLHAAFRADHLREDDLRLILNDSKVPISSMIPIADVQSPPNIGHLKWISAWLARTWENDVGNQDEALQGPAAFFGPVQLLATLRFDSSDDMRLDQISDADNALSFSVQAAIWSSQLGQSRGDALLALTLEAIRLLLLAFNQTCDRVQDPISQAKLLAEAINTSPLEHIRQSGELHLTHILSTLSSDFNSTTVIGQLCLGISRFLLDVYVTSVPMDPAVRRVLTHELLISRMERLKEELQAIEEMEMRIKGVSDSARRDIVSAKIDEVEALISNLGPSISRNSDPARLAYLFNEVNSFLSDVYSTKSINDLVAALTSGDVQALHREQSFQLAAESFIARLQAVYADLDDLVQPIITAVLFARFGLRSLARDLEKRQARPDSVVETALTFPRAAIIPQLQSGILHETSTTSDLLIASFAHAAETGNSTQREGHVQTLLLYLGALYSKWSEARMKEQHDEQAKESLYRVKKTEVEVLSDLEQEEQEFTEIFPQYNADEDGNVPIPEKPEVEEEKETGFPKSAVEAFHELVISLFSPKHRSINDQLADLLRTTVRHTFDHRSFDEHLDTTSLSWQIETLHRRLAESRKPNKTPNFYLGANEPESRKAAAIVGRLRARLDILIEEWPEQMVLQHIRDRCDRFLGLDIRSPVAMTLTNLEQLLIHIDDWEPYASRENSLKSFQAEISALLIDWRRLELSSWTRLLDDQTTQYIARDVEWTLRLFGALINGSTSSKDLTKHFESLVPMITTYLQTSSLGSFPSRVAVLDCFCRMAGEMATLPGNVNLIAVHALLSNIIGNARLFTARIDESVRTQRAVIDKAIKDYVKLASWKDVNIFALRASAQKSHKHLHRSIRKYRDVLQQPVAPMLSDLTAVVPQTPPNLEVGSGSRIFDISALPTIFDPLSTSSSTPAHILRLPDTLAKFTSLLSTRSQGDIERVGSAIDAMAVDIIETAAELASATPASLTKENTKVVANLARRKRKAYSDLLKSLRASGFSNSVRADALTRQQSSIWMLQRIPFKLDSLPEGFNSVIRSVDSYDVKLGVLLPALRAAFNGHNPDIASGDLQRGIGFTESVLATCLVQREKLVSSTRNLTSFIAKIDHIRRLAKASAIEGGQEILVRLTRANLLYSRVRQALLEAQESIKRHRELESKVVAAGDVEELHGFVGELNDLIPAIDQACASARASSYHVFSSTENGLLRSVDDIRGKMLEMLVSKGAALPMFRYLFTPLLAMIEKLPLFSVQAAQVELDTGVRQQSNDLISAILVLAQSLPAVTVESADPDETPHIPQSYIKQVQQTDSLRVTELLARLDTLMAKLSTQSTGSSIPFGTLPLAQILPFLETIGERYAQTVAQHAYAVKSTYKLCYVTGRIMLDLAQKGFCKPLEENTSKDGEGEDTVEGTGMGTGTGDKNVSSEIEEEGQVEGLQGEKEEEKDENDEDDGDDDDAVDMENDFEGELGEGKEKKDDEGEDGDEEEEEDHDEHAGDVDPLDPGAVDEKFWGEENDKEGKDQGKDEVMDQQNQEETGETEMTAKEEESKKKDEKKKDKKEEAESAEDKGEQQNMPEDDEGQEGDEGEEEEDDRGMDEDENDANPPGRPDEPNVNVDEGDRLDLPEDINLDGDSEDENDNGLNGEDDISLPAEDRGENEDMGDGDDASIASQDDGAADEDAPEATGVGEEEVKDREEVVGQNVDMSAADDANAQDSNDLGQGKGGSTEDQPKDKEAKDGEAEEEEKLDTDPAENEPEGEGSAPQDPSSGPADQNQGEGSMQSSGAPVPNDAKNQPQSKRSLGDILQDIQRRKDEILAQQERLEEVEQRADAQEEAPGQVEYLQDEDMDEGKQALGAAGEEERQKLEDLNIVDDDMEGEADAGMADDPELEDGERVDQQQDRPEHQSNQVSGTPDQQDTEKALTRADIKGSTEGPTAGDQMDLDAPEGQEEATSDPKEEEMEVEAEEAELNVLDMATVGEGRGEDQWRHYASLTSDLSYALCEQLRLILEPTLATRLQGDFRTGKRLNMRKIIPYIASEYTKDKIWLRRTKPSRREYQVLLSLDDSSSMSASHSVDLAYQTLALVAQALNKLEVGQIGIAKFGEAVDILHPFGDAGFTDADGAKVMNSFKFDQQKTDVVALVERTLSFLAEARQKQSSTSAPDLWQLQIIISDGICQDHHRLRTLLRRALEERVMMVFLVIDSLQQQPAAPTPTVGKNTRPSILSMQSVEYKDVGGNMELVMSRYLDTFPFEYYVVLRDVEALPGVLSDTLRQWMARVSQSSE